MVSETKEMAIDVEYNPTEVYNPKAENKPSEGQVRRTRRYIWIKIDNIKCKI